MLKEIDGRRYVLLDTAPFLEFTDLWKRDDQWRDSWYEPHLLAGWRNRGDKDLLAFEVVALLYDPYDRHLDTIADTVQAGGGRYFQPLSPGQTGDALMPGAFLDLAFTTVIFPRAARFANRLVWTFDEVEVAKRILELVPHGPAPASLDLGKSGQAKPKLHKAA